MNFIAEKNVKHAPFEFRYALGVSRPLAQKVRPETCQVCSESFQFGVDLFGGVGTHEAFGLRGTSHYIVPALAWTAANGMSFKVSPGFGLTGSRTGFLLRVGVFYEISQFRRAVRGMFR